MRKKIDWEKEFQITAICREDMRDYFSDEEIASLDDADMKHIANKMSDAYMNTFWLDMQIIVGGVLGNKKRG